MSRERVSIRIMDATSSSLVSDELFNPIFNLGYVMVSIASQKPGTTYLGITYKSVLEYQTGYNFPTSVPTSNILLSFSASVEPDRDILFNIYHSFNQLNPNDKTTITKALLFKMSQFAKKTRLFKDYEIKIPTEMEELMKDWNKLTQTERIDKIRIIKF
jgi:hypothetical protein